MRPVLVMNVSVMKNMKGTLEELTIANNFLSMYVIERVVAKLRLGPLSLI